MTDIQTKMLLKITKKTSDQNPKTIICTLIYLYINLIYLYPRSPMDMELESQHFPNFNNGYQDFGIMGIEVNGQMKI